MKSSNRRFGATIRFKPSMHLEAAGHVDRDDHYAAVFRGYIANRNDVRSACGIDRSFDDAHLFIAAFAKWGTSLQQHVIGEYCGVVIDEREGTAILTTDAFGLRPLFYAEQDGRLHVASHLDTLVDRIGTGALCDEFIADHLTMSRHFGSRTIFENVRRLEPGRPLELRRDGLLQECRGWHPDDIAPIRLASDADYETRFRELLDEAVTCAAGKRTWCELSGGLDSSSIYCAARARGVAGLEPISIVYSESSTADERPWMRHMVSDSTSAWHRVDEDFDAPFSLAPSEPFACPQDAALSWRMLRRYESIVAAGGADVVFSGMGGDQSLYAGGTRPVFLADELRSLRFLRVARESARWGKSRKMNRSARYVFTENAWQPLVNYLQGVRVVERQSRHTYCPWLAQGFVDRMNLAERRAASSKPRCKTVFNQYFLEDLQVVSYSMDQHWNQIVDSFEMRFPLLYRPLVEFMIGLPLHLKMRPGEDRVLQRCALAGLLPEPIRMRQDKRGPDQAFFAGLLKNPHVLDLLVEKPALVELGYVDRRAWEKVVQGARFAAVPRFSTFFASVTLELWLKQDLWREISSLGQIPTAKTT